MNPTDRDGEQVAKGERWEFRIRLSDVDRDVHLDGRPLVLAQHPSETPEHVTLRVLAWCLLYEPGLTFGPGICVGDSPDLLARDLTGDLTVWVGCGDAEPDMVRKIVQHQRQVNAHAVFADRGRFDAFAAEVDRWARPPRGWERVTLWWIDEGLLASLVARDSVRQRWSVTLTGDHMYIDADGESVDGPVQRRSFAVADARGARRSTV